MEERMGHYQYKNVTNLTDDFLRLKSSIGNVDELWEINHCQICLETFSDPRTLACKHTFCRTCLQLTIDQISSVNKHYERGFQCALCGYYTKMPNYSIPRNQWAYHVPSDYRFPPTVDQTDSLTDKQSMCEVGKESEKEPMWILDWKVSTFPKSYLLNRGLNPFKRLRNCYVFAITPDAVNGDNYVVEDEDDDEELKSDSFDVQSEITAATFYTDMVIVYDNGLQEIQMYNAEMTLVSIVKQKYVYDIAVLNSILYMTVPTDACMKVYDLVEKAFAEDLYFTKKCYGMDVYDNQIAVLMRGEEEEVCQLCYLKKVGILGDIVDLKGGRLKFKCPRQVAICPITRLIYVTDREAGLVKCYRLDGRLNWERLVYDAGTVAVYGGNLLVTREFTSSVDILQGKGEFNGRLESRKYAIHHPQSIAVSRYKSEIVIIDGNHLMHLFNIIPRTATTPALDKQSAVCVVL